MLFADFLCYKRRTVVFLVLGGSFYKYEVAFVSRVLLPSMGWGKDSNSRDSLMGLWVFLSSRL